MASNQPTQAVNVIPNDAINIPEPGSYLSGTNNGAATTLTAPAGTLFLDGQTNPAGTGYFNKVSIGDVVYEPSTGVVAQVESVDSNTQLTLSAPGLTGGGAAFDIYRGNGGVNNLKAGNEGFSLFVGTAGDLTVIPASSEDPVVLKNVGNNSYVPLQIIRVLNSGTSASDILALR